MKLLPATLCAGLAAALVLGCKVDQAQEVATYRAVLDREQPATQPFEQGEALSLERALQLANEHNERLGLVGENYLQALIDKNRAAAAFLPTISLAPSYFTQDRVSSSSNGTGSNTGGGGATNDRFDVPIESRMNLFNGFRDIAGLRSANRTADQQRALLLDAQAVVLLDVARVYYQILRAERSVEVLRNSLTVQEERLRDTRARLRAGFSRPLDVAQTEAQAAGTRVALIAALNAVENGRTVLVFLTAAPVGASILTDEAAVPPRIEELSALRDRAFAARQDLFAAMRAIEAARFNVQAAFGQYYPSIALNLNYFLSRDSNPTESDWNAIFDLNLPLFSAGLIEADVRTAWSQVRQAKYAESLLRRQIAQEVELSHQNLQRSRERLTELQVQLTAAAEALRQSEESYRVGLATNLERLTAQDRLLSTQLDLTSERFEQKVFYLNLLRSTGQLSTRLPGEATTQPATAVHVGWALPAK